MRTWSAGSLDLPLRGPDGSGLGVMPRGVPADLSKQRRSVSNNLLRRDSAGVRVTCRASGVLTDTNGAQDLMIGRDGAGPTVAKWEQLNLAPELLRSLTKFGVGPPNKIQQRALPFLLRGADIIAQAPPTQERIAAYVIPAIHVALVHSASARGSAVGPIVVMVSTTVDQATQAQRMIRDLGGPIGVRSALGVGSSTEIGQELRLLAQSMPHILCGTPQKLHALFTAPGGLSGALVRFLVLDEVDQLIARNLHEFIFGIVKLLPPPRSRPLSGGAPPANGLGERRFPSPVPPPVSAPGEGGPASAVSTIERQTALFSNTVPQDVLNLATAIQLREPVRVLVRRDGNVTHADAAQSARGLRQFYLYLALTAGGARGGSGSSSGSMDGPGLGIIGSGRAQAASSAENAQAREWKLDALGDLFEDVEVLQAIVHVGGMSALDTVVYKLASRGLEAFPLHSDMGQNGKLAALNKFRGAGPTPRAHAPRVLVVYDVHLKSPEVAHIPLVINYDLPKAVEEYAHRVAPAIAPPSAVRPGVVVNFVTATGGDVEMLRSIECFYKIKCPEVPMSLREVL
ncbi:P-loop containing nucleoside triphosphate hydrolase protein [Vararia minispora EC-137]|uniref:P-loop containing nucleoside triphosphate hydrolase protein n=1 Tax=Vararia minispora EC-137 TaxID=1314806 RepID=A0ACB8Q935_9AGAM|nr:P-loop containing nucleoside triphosphate hydrolase protein [Vararia minispora EC-137]